MFQLLDTIERIRFYEQIYDELCEADDVHTVEMKQKMELLEQYYTSALWREDYEADEQGLLPNDLRRGVLSQDGVYDLLTTKRCQG